MGDKVLFIGAHLDDAVIASGGLIRKLVDAGTQVDVVCFGNGDEAFTVPDGREAAVVRFKAETEAAHDILGVAHFECYDVPDFGVQQNRETYRQCIRAIRRYRPDIIFGHSWAEYFQHHETASFSRDAWFQAAWDCSADLGKPWCAAKYYHFEVLHDLPEPTHLVDVSDTFKYKLEAWGRFETARDHLGSLGSQLEARARHHGSKIGVRYAEAYRRSFFTPEKVTAIEALF